MAVINEKRQFKNREKRKKEDETLRLKKEIRAAWNEKRIKKKKRQKMDRFSKWMDKYGWQYKKKDEPKEEMPLEEISQFEEERTLFQAVFEEEQKAEFSEVARSSELISEIKVEDNPIKKEVEQLEEVGEFVETLPSLECGTFSTKRVYKVFKRRRNDEITDGKPFAHESVSEYSLYQDHDYCYNTGADNDPLKIDYTETSSFDMDIKEENLDF